MNPLYKEWLRHVNHEVRVGFLIILYNNYDGMLEETIKSIKKAKRRERDEEIFGNIFYIGSLVRILRSLFR